MNAATAPPAAPAALEAFELIVRFGGITALSGVSLRVPHGTLVGLVGPNGAGKSTAFAVLSGLLRPNAGRVELDGLDVTRASPQARARRGLARTFQQPELFEGLTVRDHLILADRIRNAGARLWRDTFCAGALWRSSRAEQQRVDRLVDQLGLTRVADQSVDALPFGTSRLVEVGRALATEPSVVLLDEPTSGLTEYESEELATTLRRTVDERGVAVVLVEHDVPMVLNLCSHVFVLDFGICIADGAPSEIRVNEQVQTAYLGRGDTTRRSTTTRTHRESG